MSAIIEYKEDGSLVTTATSDHDRIATRLHACGVRFERWQADHELTCDAGQDEVIAAYRDAIDELNDTFGFSSVDVVSLGPDHPQKDEMRNKFLSEHTHDDFEIRFFVEGQGLFYLHIEDRVILALCSQGDLISVPAKTRHWFDMGTAPNFKCIRFFTTPDGWVADFTGSDIAKRFPSFDETVAALK